MTLKNLIPKEHGAWAILVLPYFIGISVGGGSLTKGIIGLLGVILLFLSRQPLLLLLKRIFFRGGNSNLDRKKLWQSFLFFSIPGIVIFLWLFKGYRLPGLFILGSLAGTLIFVHTWLAMHRKERTLVGEIIGAGVLTLTAPLGIVLSRGNMSTEAFILWLLNVSYFTGSIFYIKMRKKALRLTKRTLHFPENMNFVKECLAYILILALVLVLLAFTTSVPLLVSLAFVPMIAHTLWGIFVLRPRFEIMKQGIIQTQLSLIYTLLVIIFWK